MPIINPFLCSHIGDNATLVVIKNAGHALNVEKPKEFAKHLKAFLIGPETSSQRSGKTLFWG